ncbi:hypothetical protein GTA08_BOTSDO02421 [Botryosphaeria dothidea]|uniref:Uncharacterized protein n=1 Tax=Botryosphaeria dothidea TaxID=55169 RepID=A0A8H4N400_9PEZI|nr:hypothetical protein GTA08_BOTSDO02421 [Botryosphaeria dothidea]
MNMPDEVENANREYDKGILSRSMDQEPDEGAVIESVESDVLGAGPAANDGLYKRPGTRAIRESSFSHSNLSAPNSVDKIGLDESGAIGTARYGTEDAIELTRVDRYQRRVDSGEVKMPTDQDRTNYVNWKQNYKAYQAQKQREEKDVGEGEGA